MLPCFPLEAIACVSRGSLTGIANESITIGVRVTLFPTRGDRVCSSRLSHWPASFKNSIRFLAGACVVLLCFFLSWFVFFPPKTDRIIE